MLNVNVQTGQSVTIGTSKILKVLEIRSVAASDTTGEEQQVVFELTEYDGSNNTKFAMEPAIQLVHGIPIADNVKLFLKNIQFGNKSGDIKYAVLGFEAPREITIRGDWLDGNTTKTISQKLHEMSTGALIYYGKLNAKSPLEHELLRRLKEGT